MRHFFTSSHPPNAMLKVPRNFGLPKTKERIVCSCFRSPFWFCSSQDTVERRTVAVSEDAG